MAARVGGGEMWFPVMVLFRAWLSSPVRAGAGILGIVLIMWSVLPLASRSLSPRRASITSRPEMLDFVEGVEETWRRSWIRGAAGIAGIALFVWSAWPIATMR